MLLIFQERTLYVQLKLVRSIGIRSFRVGYAKEEKDIGGNKRAPKMEHYDYNPNNIVEKFPFGVLYDAFDTKTTEPVALLKLYICTENVDVKKDILKTLAIDEEDILATIADESKKIEAYIIDKEALYDDDTQYNEALEEEENNLLSELLRLHQKLDEVRHNTNQVVETSIDSSSSGWPQNKRRQVFDGFRAIVCGNSIPVSVFLNEQGTGYVYRKSRNSLQPSLNMLSSLGGELQWLSWPGCAGVTKYAQNGISKQMQEKYKCCPVFLNVNTAQSYMEFCDEVLYPIFFSTLAIDSTTDSTVERASSHYSLKSNEINTSDAFKQSVLANFVSVPHYSIKKPPINTSKVSALNQQRRLPSTPIFSFVKHPAAAQQQYASPNAVTGKGNRVTNSNRQASSVGGVTVFLAKLKLRMAMFEEVQKVYLNKLTEMYEDDDTNIIVNDVTLILLPNLIRKRFYGASITFVMRCPFPTFDVFSVFAGRKELLEGCLGADIILFDHFDFVQNFVLVCERLLGLEASPNMVEFEGRIVKLIVLPPGIEPKKYAKYFAQTSERQEQQIAKVKAVDITTSMTDKTAIDDINTQADIEGTTFRERLAKLQEEFKGKKLVVAYDEFSRVSGILQTVASFARYLQQNPKEWKEKKIVFVQMVYGWTVPAVTEKRRYTTDTLKVLSRQINKLISTVNGMYGAVDYVPLRLIRNVTFQDRLVMYHIASVGIVCNLKGGIDVTGLEFVAAQDKRNPGVLLYSEFLACSTSLKGVLTINPYDIDAVSDTLGQALGMSSENRQWRLLQLLKYVNKYNASNWASQLCRAVNRAKLAKLENISVLLPKYSDLQAMYFSSGKRLFVLSYQGVLSPDFSAFPQVAPPSPKSLGILRRLCSNMKNVVYIIGGISKNKMETWFSGIPRLGLIMEYGYAYRMHDEVKESETGSRYLLDSTSDRVESKWSPSVGSWDIDFSWKGEVMEVLQHYAIRTPGAYIDVSLESCIAWHYHHADLEFGQAQAKELYTVLDSMLTLLPVEAIFSSQARTIVIRRVGCNGATALARILDRLMQPNLSNGEVGIGNGLSPVSNSFDFVFCVASHRYDIGIFSPILSRYREGKVRNALTCMVPKGVTKAQYYVEKRQMVMDILQGFASSNR